MTVLTSYEWVVQIIDGLTIKNNKIQICRDADGNPYIGHSVLNDPVWDFTAEVTSPDDETRQLKDWFWEIEYNPILDDIL